VTKKPTTIIQDVDGSTVTATREPTTTVEMSGSTTKVITESQETEVITETTTKPANAPAPEPQSTTAPPCK